MGKSSHPFPQSLSSSTANLVAGRVVVVSSNTVRSAGGSPSPPETEGNPLQIGDSGLPPAHPEISTHIVTRAPGLFSSPPLPPSDTVGVSRFPSNVALRTGLVRASGQALHPPRASMAPNLPSPAFLVENAHRNVPQLSAPMRPQPLVKACILSSGAPGMPALPDTNLIQQSLNVCNIDPDHITLRIGELIDTDLDEFFDPTYIREGGILILVVSCHGHQGCAGNVSLEFKTRDGTIVDSQMLQEKIGALPEHCTLEVVVDTCCAEGVIPGLFRISTVDPSFPWVMPSRSISSTLTDAAPSGSRLNARISVFRSHDAVPNIARLPNHSFSLFEQKQPRYKARVVVWAASTMPGNSYTEEDLPQKPGRFSILIGAMFNYLSSNGPNISRQNVWANVLKVVEQHNDARRKRDLNKPPGIRASLIEANRIQRPVLLTSVDSPEQVLSGFIFQPI